MIFEIPHAPLLTFCPACKVNVWTAAYVQHLAYHSMLLQFEHARAAWEYRARSKGAYL